MDLFEDTDTSPRTCGLIARAVEPLRLRGLRRLGRPSTNDVDLWSDDD
jgi:hypothetical protein